MDKRRINNSTGTESRRNELRRGVLFSLFATSYTPLFVLIILRQVLSNESRLRWGGVSFDSIGLLVQYFGVAIIAACLSIFGVIGAAVFFRNIRQSTRTNGVHVKIVDVKNKNSEAIGYIGTYIIPFLFADYSGLYEVLSITILMMVVYMIYVNSALILINPVISLRYSLYEVDFNDNMPDTGAQISRKNGLIITSERFLREGDRLLFKAVGPKLYFAEHNNEQHS